MQQVEIKQLIRSKRRTIGLEITDQGELIVRAPKRASFGEIESLIREKNGWIIRHQQDIQKKSQAVAAKQFREGEKFLFLGEYYFLTIVANSASPLTFDNGFYLAAKYLEKAQKIFERWYWQQAYEKISVRVEWYALQHQFSYSKIRINNPKRQWGSCSVDGKLSFTWRLIMAPLAVLDYVVVHELVHTRYKNHSQRYWQKVATIMPDYKQHKKWLKEHDHLLKI